MGLDLTQSFHVAALVDAAKGSFNVLPIESRSENGPFGNASKAAALSLLHERQVSTNLGCAGTDSNVSGGRVS